MANTDKYNEIFMNTFGVSEEQLPGIAYQAIPEWDSVGHMAMIADLEDAFNIMFETDDIIDFNSYEKGRELLKKYDVEV